MDVAWFVIYFQKLREQLEETNQSLKEIEDVVNSVDKHNQHILSNEEFVMCCLVEWAKEKKVILT